MCKKTCLWRTVLEATSKILVKVRIRLCKGEKRERERELVSIILLMSKNTFTHKFNLRSDVLVLYLWSMKKAKWNVTLNLSVPFRKPVTSSRLACIFSPFQLEYETMIVETPLMIESEYAGMWMLSSPCMSITVLFSLMPLVVPPSPTKCLAQAATLSLPEIFEN